MISQGRLGRIMGATAEYGDYLPSWHSRPGRITGGATAPAKTWGAAGYGGRSWSAASVRRERTMTGMGERVVEDGLFDLGRDPIRVRPRRPFGVAA
jgi:hypothetical protein